MSTYKFSFYKGPIRNVKPEATALTLGQAVDLIRSDKYKDHIEKLRTTDNKDIRKTLKNVLDFFTFSGVFTKRIADGLKKHSGLIVLDFDDLSADDVARLKTDFSSLDFVAAVFVSPSGNGLKVVVRISGEKAFPTVAAYQLQAFRQLAQFFDDNFDIKIDESGKDVPRVCFVSWDPTAFYNDKATVIEVNPPTDDPGTGDIGAKDLVKDKPADAKAATSKVVDEYARQRKVASDLARVEHVVQQIERDQVDITDDDYDNRMNVGFALATLGEAARDFYKRTVQFNDHDEDDDAKFNDALGKGRFKSPAKFFALAKDAGLSIALPRTLQEVQKKAEALQIIGDQSNTDDFVKYGIYLKKSTNTYWALDMKGIPREISNFSLRILYHINTGDDVAYRLMVIKNIHGLEETLRINTDDFVGAGSFKKVIARKGNFLWKGQDHDLVRLQDMLQRNERHTTMVETLGWNKRSKFYAFANGVFDTTDNIFLPIDEHGIVESTRNGKPINYFIPALSKVFVDKDNMYVNEKKFIYINGSTSYADWSNQILKVFGENGRMGIVIWACALFSDILYQSMGDRMPLPYSYGKRGSGKGTMIQSILMMWGEKQKPIMLGGSTTPVGLMRKMAQICNGMVWLDEFKNGLPFKIIESIKNLYDRNGPTRGKMDNGFATENVPVLSLVWFSGQELPTGEPALFTRTIMMTFEETVRTENARVEFRKLRRMENDGLSHLTVMMMQYRNLFEARFQDEYESALRSLSVEVNNNDVDERLLSSYAMMLATGKLMTETIGLPFSLAEFKDQCINTIKQQYFILAGSDDTSKFWQVVEQLVGAYILKEDEHYVLRNGYVYLFVQDVYHHYVKAMNERREINILDKSTLENYLKSDARAFIARKKMKIGQKYSHAMQFKYAPLGIDLIRGVEEKDIRAKFSEMGLEYENENEPSNDGMPEPVQNEIDFNEFLKK
ncbi:DUF927 domain-containing protein [Sphingobacterium alkalisoli]|uniref:DUF927 domain-containing protein n=1 Tax=Sphingobacterium alkalisoli TaxID=1874115 RepID=A0A4U0GUQ5_9SPHI|nr:BT4734/BF3469 family protein [Sphingobacterium alkalisoli]TJY62718.1 DUF927 domain-containing protein [Sphingobacterium alkalisoli]GGH28410.1 hypothetical protein GCM10011418_39060 [Sphingobacterium alkalisoli]